MPLAWEYLQYDFIMQRSFASYCPKALSHPRHTSIAAFLHLVLDVEQHIRQPPALGQTV